DTAGPGWVHPLRMELCGSGGVTRTSEQLSARLGYDVPLLAQVPLEVALREGGDVGSPVVTSNPDGPASTALHSLADQLASRSRGLAGMQLGLSPVGS